MRYCEHCLRHVDDGWRCCVKHCIGCGVCMVEQPHMELKCVSAEPGIRDVKLTAIAAYVEDEP